MLRDLNSDLSQAKIDLLFVQIKSSVRDRMHVTGLLEHIGADHIFPSVDAAVQSFLAREASGVLLPATTGAAEHTA